MIVIEAKYNFGDIVYLVRDEEQLPRMITMIKVTPGSLIYQLSCGEKYSDHYECEISVDVNQVTKVK